MEPELIEVEAVLYDGERIALRTGNMWTLYRIVHDALSGEWERFKSESFIARKSGTDMATLRAAFDHGFNRGIAYACSQIEWDIQDRAQDPTDGNKP